MHGAGRPRHLSLHELASTLHPPATGAAHRRRRGAAPEAAPLVAAATERCAAVGADPRPSPARLVHSTPAAAPRVPRLAHSTPATATRMPRLVHSKGGVGNMLSLRILENRTNTTHSSLVFARNSNRLAAPH